jgi:hypothetical protein
VAGRESKRRVAGVGALIAIWTFFDALIIGLPTLFLSAWFNALVVFLVVAVVVTLVNVAACQWVDTRWDTWIAGTRFDDRMQKVRSGKRARRPVEWIGRGSDFWFGLAAVVLNPVQVTALVRLLSGSVAGRRRIVVASLSYSIVIVAIFCLFGFALRDVIQAL